MISNACISPASAPHNRGPVSSALFAATLMFSSIGAVRALPIELTAAQFAAQTAGLTVATEDFEGFPVGATSNPLTLSNGRYTTSFPSVPDIDVGTLLCGDTDQCLAATTFTDARTFSAFPSGATFWATDFLARDDRNTFEVTVTGLSGTSVFTHTLVDAFWGFSDSLGLTSISFRNLGFRDQVGNVFISLYSFDNVRTAPSSIPVPEPAALALMGLGLAGFRLAGNRGGLRAAG